MLAPLQTPLVPKAGLLIVKSARVRPGTYALPSGGTGPALVVRGDGVTVDFTGVTLRGTPAWTSPDARTGLGVLVQGKNVTIKGLTARGYKVALYAREAKGLKLIDCDFSYNWKQRLLSTPEREDPADWMSFHRNEQGEWLNAGVGAYLDRCEGFEVRGLRVVGGQSGLFLDRSSKGLVWNCDLSYNSALGIGMYRASDNRIMHNRIDYDVRGFSYGVYHRGQDSAGILVFEQSSRNLFAYNSATHGGDGFFLWAGGQTMDSGEGGCNDNLCFANDFSHAATNGIEATFSRNLFVGNRVHGAFHGLWGGYSYDTQIVGNDFRDDQRGIAIDRGQVNTIAFNRFRNEDVAVALWAGPLDPALGYAKKRDVRNRDNRLVGNDFRGAALALDLQGATNTLVSENEFDRVGQAVRVRDAGKDGSPFPPLPVENRASGSAPGSPASGSPTTNLPGTVEPLPASSAPDSVWNPLDPAPWAAEAIAKYRIAPLKGGRMPFIPKGVPQGWSTIVVDEWGPYDGRRPILLPETKLSGGAPLPGGTSPGSGARKPGRATATGRYRILGPRGRWRLVSAQGAKVGAKEGAVPGVVAIELPKDPNGLTKVEMEYVGAATTDVRGVTTPAGRPVRFGFSRLFAPIDWSVRFFAWRASENPDDPHAPPKDFATVLLGRPLKQMRTDRLDLAGSALAPGLPNARYATAADGVVTLPKGEYTVELTTDDGARVWIDGKPLIDDAWRYQGPTTYRRDVTLAAGRHRLRVEHFQIDGAAALKVTIRPKG